MEIQVDERIELLLLLAGPGNEGLVTGHPVDNPADSLSTAAKAHRAAGLVGELVQGSGGLAQLVDLAFTLTKPPTICVDIAAARRFWPDLGAGWWFGFGEALQDFCLESGFAAWFASQAGLHRTWVERARQGWPHTGLALPGCPGESPGGDLAGMPPGLPELLLVSAWDLEVPDRLVLRRGRKVRVRLVGHERTGSDPVSHETPARLEDPMKEEGVDDDQESA